MTSARLVKIGTSAVSKHLFYNLAKAKAKLRITSEHLSDTDAARIADMLDTTAAVDAEQAVIIKPHGRS